MYIFLSIRLFVVCRCLLYGNNNITRHHNTRARRVNNKHVPDQLSFVFVYMYTVAAIRFVSEYSLRRYIRLYVQSCVRMNLRGVDPFFNETIKFCAMSTVT